MRTEFTAERAGLGQANVDPEPLTVLDTATSAWFIDGRVAGGLGGRWYGVFPATVTDIKDPDGIGRVKVALPWSPDTGSDKYEAWARVATLMGGNNRGSWFIPDMNDEVLVSFEGATCDVHSCSADFGTARTRRPNRWMAAGNNNKKVLRSRNGVKITLDDQDGQETFICETPGGQKITLKDGPGSVEIVDRTATRSSSKQRHHP